MAGARGHAELATKSGKARMYHSTALLLPDASILVGGGGSPGPQTNTNAEIYYPLYLYTRPDSLRRGRRITAAPTAIVLGQQFLIDVPGAAAINRVTLVKTGSVTHSFNMDQRFLEPKFERVGDRLKIFAPVDLNRAPPGKYLLFIIDAHGVPSIGRILSFTAA